MGTLKVLTGNYAAAEAAAKCRLDLISAYPITPQSSVVEHLAELVYNGEIDAEMVQVESEHTAMSVVQGAAAGGGRVFTATSAQGLALMYEPYFRMSTLRLPMVMAIATREMTSPETIWSGQQDAVSVREAGWIQMFCDDNQEIADMIVQGYMIAEHPDVCLPVNICYDGFYSSHLTSGVIIPDQEEVDRVLIPHAVNHKPILDPDYPLALDPMTPGSLLMHYRKNHLEAMQKAQDVIDGTDKRFAEVVGRSYGGVIEEYRCDDAEVVVVTMGGITGAGKDAVDEAREKGIRAGLIKIRFYRPFPAKRIAKALHGKKAFCVVDRSVSFGWNRGSMYVETCAALSGGDEKQARFSAIGGLGGADVSFGDMVNIIVELDKIKDQPGEHETRWLMHD